MGAEKKPRQDQDRPGILFPLLVMLGLMVLFVLACGLWGFAGGFWFFLGAAILVPRLSRAYYGGAALRKRQKPAPKAGGAPASIPVPVVPAPVPAIQQDGAAAADLPPPLPLPASPLSEERPKAKRNIPAGKCLLWALLLALLLYGGYARGRIKSLEQELASAQEELEEISRDLDRAEDHLDTMQNRVRDLTDQLNSAERRLEAWENLYNYYDSAPVYGYYNYNTHSPPSYPSWVWISQYGTKYHSTSSCSNMQSPRYVTYTEAIIQGYSRCSKCW